MLATTSSSSSSSSTNSFQVCPDDHKCQNGSICVENPLAEGKYFCDCSSTASSSNNNNNNVVYTGLYCQYRATGYCTITGEISHQTFCANKGSCKSLVDATNAQHMGCTCPKGYEGDHCQFIEGTTPKGWPTEASFGKGQPGGIGGSFFGGSNGSTSSSSYSSSTAQDAVTNGGNGNGTISASVIGFIVIVAVIVALLGIIVVSRRLWLKTTHHVVRRGAVKSTDGHLHNPDGDTLTTQVRNTTTPTFDSSGDVYMQDHHHHHGKIPHHHHHPDDDDDDNVIVNPYHDHHHHNGGGGGGGGLGGGMNNPYLDSPEEEEEDPFPQSPFAQPIPNNNGIQLNPNEDAQLT